MSSTPKNLTRTALLLALVLLFQSLRLVIPISPFLSTFLIGSLINSCLLIAVEMVGVGSALVIVFLTPVVAYFQQVLPFPIFILPVALGNAIYIAIFLLGKHWKYGMSICVAAACKAAFMYFAFSWLLTLVEIPAKIAIGLLFAMSWPQFVTGLLGGLLADIIKKRLKLL